MTNHIVELCPLSRLADNVWPSSLRSAGDNADRCEMQRCGKRVVSLEISGGKFLEIYSSLSGNLLKNFFSLYTF